MLSFAEANAKERRNADVLGTHAEADVSSAAAANRAIADEVGAIFAFRALRFSVLVVSSLGRGSC